MKFIIRIHLVLTLLLSNSILSQIAYPATKKVPVIDIYHTTKITDNYQWLEAKNNEDVKQWVDNQNRISRKYLKKISRKYSSETKMRAYGWYEMDYDKKLKYELNNKMRFKIRHLKNNSLPSIYYAKGSKSEYKNLVAPNSISTKDRIIFTGFKPSRNDEYLAYHYNRNGSDWKEIKIIGIKKRRYFKEVLKNILNPSIYWLGSGFYYIKSAPNVENSNLYTTAVMYHNLGTPQVDDELIFRVSSKEEQLYIIGAKDESIYIILKKNSFKNEFSYYFLEPKDDKKAFKPFYEKIKYNLNLAKIKADTAVVLTKIKGEKFLVRIPIKKPNNWVLLSPSYNDAVFTGYEFVDDKIASSYQSKESSFIAITDFNGKILGEVTTPKGLSISNMHYNAQKKVFTFKLSSYTVPPVSCVLDLKTFQFKYLGKADVYFNSKNYRFMRKEFISHDGKKVPMFIVYKDSISKDAKTPFLLKTYGGYGKIEKPKFNSGIIYFIENGGAFAYVNIRGGGELGEKWWKDGKKLKKKNGILDFTYAAKYLINQGYTKPKKIGVIGTSHGGLIAASALIESPEIYGAAVINVAPTDMLRMEKSRTGSAFINLSEYGTVKKENEFRNLLSYSPFHNIKEGVNYPSTLIITGSNDTRVPSYNSYKFAGKLQNRGAQKNPILLWTQDKYGHFGAIKYNDFIEEKAFIYSFLINELKKN
ncbi:prolyl oligopeptidase family serine peptidase [uncultured Polaribacter sp.]|uniref:prolyl oligopeptidase family serine peptidase n=1 Tax=uncultured Polaribacter sp. TaxID=174711 RepID=UPI002624BED3|nr:prolyl oligopeptidase family serine peptidase [uncultured Polaribacter sp.]